MNAWRSNEDEWQKKANPRGAELDEFVQLWHDAHGTAEVTPKELLSLAEEHELFAFVFSKNTPQARGATFGKLLAHHSNAPIGQWFIRQRVARQTFYRLEVIP
jgi:EAL domain-containing protein (putative c-di-GMP-specific phosphodiesterase class I)